MEQIKVFKGETYRLPGRITAYIVGSPMEVQKITIPPGEELRELSPVNQPEVLRIWHRDPDHFLGHSLDIERHDDERFYTLYRRS